MQNPNSKIPRSSSCHGVSFEIKPDPITLPDATTDVSRRTQSSRIIPTNFSSLIQRSISISSSHFCDLEIDEFVDVEKGKFVNPGTNPVPQEKRSLNSRLSVILLDQGLFTVYKRLFLLVLGMNLMTLILTSFGNFPYAKDHAAVFSIANIFLCVLFRNEVFLRVLFWLAVRLLGHLWIPVRIKTAATSFLQSLGGIHSGCGFSSIAWLVYSLILTFQAARAGRNTSLVIECVACAILILLILSSLAAFPVVRHLHHNVFERAHRFAGWAALILLWVFVVLGNGVHSDNVGRKLVRGPDFWFTVGITVLIVLPWIGVRRVPVKISSPSGHASVIKFSGGVKPGILGRISPSPLSEWHAFGIISDNQTEHTMLVGAVGDFTESLVKNPPTHLWVRRVGFPGLPYLANLYGRVLLVATGSGICVFLSFLLQPCTAEIRLIWVTKGVEENFGKEIKEWVSAGGGGEGKVIVHDTAVSGRPDVAAMSVEAARKFSAEAVIVTSNPAGSRDVVNACTAAGIAAFGPIWDS